MSTGGGGRQGYTEDGASIWDVDVCLCDGEFQAFFGGSVSGIFPYVKGVVLASPDFVLLGYAWFAVGVLGNEVGYVFLLATGGTDFGLANKALNFFEFQNVPSLPCCFLALATLGFVAIVEGCWIFYATRIALVKLAGCWH